jgi:uncharacterized protein with GYD domain
MEFVVLGKYTAAGLSGFAQNPNDDRKAVISAMIEKAGGRMHDLWLTRGEYDAVVIGEVPDFETIAAIKMMVLASGAMSEIVVLEAADFNAIGKRAASLMAGAAAYQPPGG